MTRDEVKALVECPYEEFIPKLMALDFTMGLRIVGDAEPRDNVRLHIILIATQIAKGLQDDVLYVTLDNGNPPLNLYHVEPAAREFWTKHSAMAPGEILNLWREAHATAAPQQPAPQSAPAPSALQPDARPDYPRFLVQFAAIDRTMRRNSENFGIWVDSVDYSNQLIADGVAGYELKDGRYLFSLTEEARNFWWQRSGMVPVEILRLWRERAKP